MKGVSPFKENFSGKEYVGGLVGLKERIQEASKPDAPCSVFIGMVGRELHDKKSIIMPPMNIQGVFFNGPP